MAALVLTTLISPFTAAADTIYDFEDGTFQGWEPMNDVFIAPTNGVFGPGDAFALFGIDGAWISMEVDLTNVDQLILDVFTPSSAALESLALYVTVRPGNTPPFDSLGTLDPVDVDANPGQLVISLAHLTGVHAVQIAWNGLSFLTDSSNLTSRSEAESRFGTIYFPAYIDRITFTTTVPEPAAVALITLAIVGLTVKRRRVSMGRK